MCLWDGTTSQDQLEDHGSIGLKLSRTLWGPPGHKSLSMSPISYLKEKGFQLPQPSLSFKGHFQTVANQGSEGRQEETIVQQGAWRWFLLR